MKTIQNQKGFTLVEALIAVAILTIGILTVITMQTTTVKGNAKARGITVASTWAQDTIETILHTDYDEIVTDSVDSPDGNYTISWTVDENVLQTVNDHGGYEALKHIEVTVTRNDFGGQRDVTFNFYKQIVL